MIEPTDKELEAFAIEEQFLLFCDVDEFTQIARAVLAKWGVLRAEKIVIPTDTMEQEFQKHYRLGYEAGKKAAAQPAPAAVAAEPDAFRCLHEWDGLARTSMPPRYACKHCHNFFDAPPTHTPQADSQPAPDEATAMSRTRDLAEAGRWPSDWVEAYRRGYSDRASSAPADSVLEDAARLEQRSQPSESEGMTIAGNGASELGKLMREQRALRGGFYPDGNPNTARTQGANHD